MLARETCESGVVRMDARGIASSSLPSTDMSVSLYQTQAQLQQVVVLSVETFLVLLMKLHSSLKVGRSHFEQQSSSVEFGCPRTYAVTHPQSSPVC
jgi:hypothetical protein